MEDQDFWRMSGIFRSVKLVSRAPLYVRDFYARPVLDADYRDATLRLKVKVRNASGSDEQVFVGAKLLDASRRAVARPLNGRVGVRGGSEAVLEMEQKVSNPSKWSAEEDRK